MEEESPGFPPEETQAVAAALAREEADRLPQVIRALGNPNFRLFWSGNFLSNIGTWMQNVAQGWLVLTLTDSAFWLGVVGFAGSIPFLFFTLFGGVVADRVDKRRLLIVTQTAMMILAFLLAALAYWKIITVWEVAALAFLNGVAMSMNAPSYQALVPKLVRREDLTNAIALNSAQFNMSRILGPTLGGYAMAWFGVAGNFFLNGLSFLAVLWALTRIRFPLENLARHQTVFASLRAGFVYVRRQPQMYAVVWMMAFSSFLAIPFITFIPYFAKIQLNVGASGLGWLMACSGAGAVCSAVTVAWFGVIRHRGSVIALTGAAVEAVLITFCFSHSYALCQVLMFFEGFGMIVIFSSVNVAMQHLSSDEMRGRVMSIFATCFLGLPPLGCLLAGELSRFIPTNQVLALMCGMALIAYLSFFFFSRPLRELD